MSANSENEPALESLYRDLESTDFLPDVDMDWTWQDVLKGGPATFDEIVGARMAMQAARLRAEWRQRAHRWLMLELGVEPEDLDKY